MRRKPILAVSASLAVCAMELAVAAAKDSARLPQPRPPLASGTAARVASARASRVRAFDDVARLPRPRPSIEPTHEVADWAAAIEARFHDAEARFADDPAPRSSESAIAAIENLAPLPRPRPASGGPDLALVMPRLDLQSIPVAPKDVGCSGRLRTLGVVFTEEPPIDVGGSCPVPHPLNVTSLGSGVSIGPETILSCTETESLARWVKDIVVPSAARLLGEAPTRIVHDSAYVCRSRYNDPDQKISEHAHANAIDIASFGFADRAPLDIGRSEAGSAEARFEAEIREGSCTYFTTVLGPGSNAAHASHFHLDMAFRRGGYRLCELGGPSTVATP